MDLGLEAMHLKSTPEDQAVYWSRIRETIIEVGRASRGRLNTLLLFREEGPNPTFIQVVQDALQDLLPDAPPHETSALVFSARVNDVLDLLWLPARGAADLAKRSQEAPPVCKEPSRCAANRRCEGPTGDQILLPLRKQAPLLEL